MSVQYTSRVWDQSKQKGTSRLMLLAIADSATKDIGVAWPGLGTLAKMMGPKYSRRAAGQRIEALARTGELGVFPRHGRSHDYIVLLGMERGEVKRAYKTLASRRHTTVSKLIDLRRSFARQTKRESSQVPATKTSQGVRRLTSTIRKEPLSEPVAVAAAAAASIFSVWEQEARTPLSPFLHDELGEMVDAFGFELAADAIRESVKSTGPGQFSVKYVWRILERWQREGRGERKGSNGNGHKPAETKPAKPVIFHAPPPKPKVDPARAVEILMTAKQKPGGL